MTIAEHAQPFRAEGGRVGVLLCHGFTGTPKSLIDWARHLADAGYTVSLPRLPGHGTSWQELNVTSWRDWYDHVDAEYLALRERCDTVFVAGLSMGGSLALRLAEQHPDVAGLMHVVRTVRSIGNDIHREGVEEGGYDLTPVAAVHELTRLWADVRTCLDLVTCPIVLFRSAVDHVVPGASSDAVARLVSSDDITEVILPDSYHVATMDYDAETIFTTSVAFIERVSAESARR